MRKPRDYDAELRALEDKAKLLRQRKVQQLGELVAATGADALPIHLLAGALLAAKATDDPATKEAWRAGGAAFFQGTSDAGGSTHRNSRRGSSGKGGATSSSAADRAE